MLEYNPYFVSNLYAAYTRFVDLLLYSVIGLYVDVSVYTPDSTDLLFLRSFPDPLQMVGKKLITKCLNRLNLAMNCKIFRKRLFFSPFYTYYFPQNLSQKFSSCTGGSEKQQTKTHYEDSLLQCVIDELLILLSLMVAR